MISSAPKQVFMHIIILYSHKKVWDLVFGDTVIFVHGHLDCMYNDEHHIKNNFHKVIRI